MLNKSKLLDIRNSAEAILRENILDFWMKHTVDYKHGGFLGKVENDGSSAPESEKGAIMHSRILWAFSAAYYALKQEEYLQFAKKAFDYINQSFLDKKYGGLFWLLDHRGKPVDATKKMDCQAYAIYALCEYYRAAGDSAALEMARAICEKLESHSRDIANDGYWNELPENWSSESLPNQKRNKTLNTHIHLLEAYTRLYEETKSVNVKNFMSKLIRLISERFYRPEAASYQLEFDEKWHPVSENKLYGMDIESSWLLLEAAKTLGEKDVENRAAGILTDTAKKMLAEGMDQDGGLFYEAIGDKITNYEKHWWPQTEAVVGLLHSYQLNGDEDFLNAALEVWEFIQEKIVDFKNGEWHHHVNPDGKIDPREPKAGIWKCPYHNTRACLETIKILQTIADQPETGNK